MNEESKRNIVNIIETTTLTRKHRHFSVFKDNQEYDVTLSDGEDGQVGYSVCKLVDVSGPEAELIVEACKTYAMENEARFLDTGKESEELVFDQEDDDVFEFLASEEIKLIEGFRKMDDEEKESFIEFMRRIGDKYE